MSENLRTVKQLEEANKKLQEELDKFKSVPIFQEILDLYKNLKEFTMDVEKQKLCDTDKLQNKQFDSTVDNLKDTIATKKKELGKMGFHINKKADNRLEQLDIQLQLYNRLLEGDMTKRDENIKDIVKAVKLKCVYLDETIQNTMDNTSKELTSCKTNLDALYKNDLNFQKLCDTKDAILRMYNEEIEQLNILSNAVKSNLIGKWS